MKALVGWGLLAFAVFWLCTAPDQAANLAHALWSGLVHTAHGLTNFLNRL